jgi:hypothetical protein
LSDTASFVTQVRLDNMFKSAGIHGSAPRLGHSNAVPLMEPKELLEHTNLARSTMQIGRQRTSQRKGKAYSPRGPVMDQGHSVSHANENQPRPSSTNPFRKDFRGATTRKGPGPQISSQ